MSDNYEQVRSLPFPTLAGLLGLDMGNYKQRKHGQEFYGPCPIHNPKQNSTSFSYAIDGRFNCFSCGAKGRGAIDLTKLVKGLGFQDAVKWLQTSCSAGATETPANSAKTPPKPILAQSDDVLKPLEKDTWRKFAVACPWLEQRIGDAAIRERYGVFCYNNPARKSAYSGRVMIPIRDVEGHLYGYLGRLVPTDDSTEQPKYLFPKNLPKSRFLFGAHEIAAGMFGQAPLKRVYLVESPFCVLKFASMQIPAVSPFGWSVSAEQIQLLRQLTRGAVYLPDRNKAGHESASVVQEISRHLWLRFPPLPDGIYDPEQMDKQAILAL